MTKIARLSREGFGTRLLHGVRRKSSSLAPLGMTVVRGFEAMAALPRCAAARFEAALLISVLLCPASWTQQQASEAVSIRVHANQSDGSIRPIWNYFGYDEPNYTYAANGEKLLREFAALSSEPAYIRVHNILTSGDGSPALKWGSTNAYTEDAAGNAVYSWTIVDRIFDTFRETGVKPLVEIGFMPEALSTHPEPYRHTFPKGTVFTGWAYPPKDYAKWSELVFQFARHLRERYGDAEVKTWMWEVWNEPDIEYWKGTPEEFFKLYDVSSEAVLRALPGARIGGPDSTGPASPKAVEFLRQFLEHCAHRQNYATGKTGSRLDFISFHPKGSPKWQADHVQMGIARQLQAIEQGFKIVASFPEWKNTPIVLGESDPEGCAACSAEQNPQNAYRNGPLYASYTAEVLSNIYALAVREHVNFLAAVNWSFEFEDQPYFAGYREMASNGIDKPVLNTFRMFGMLGNDRVKVSSSGALASDAMIKDGVRAQPDVNAIATRKNNEVDILVWNYHDDDLPSSGAPIDLSVEELPSAVVRALTEHFRIDATHSNAFAAWKEMGSPQQPSVAQYQQLESAGQLELLGSPSWVAIDHGTAHLRFPLPRQGLSFLRITW
jgi:xylan 1,4-beta-xylosidase